MDFFRFLNDKIKQNFLLSFCKKLKKKIVFKTLFTCLVIIFVRKILRWLFKVIVTVFSYGVSFFFFFFEEKNKNLTRRMQWLVNDLRKWKKKKIFFYFNFKLFGVKVENEIFLLLLKITSYVTWYFNDGELLKSRFSYSISLLL